MKINEKLDSEMSDTTPKCDHDHGNFVNMVKLFQITHFVHFIILGIIFTIFEIITPNNIITFRSLLKNRNFASGNLQLNIFLFFH